MNAAVDVHAACIGPPTVRKVTEILHEFGLFGLTKPRVLHASNRVQAAGYTVADPPVPLRNIRLGVI